MKIRITRSDLRKWRYVDFAVSDKISTITELPTYVDGPRGILEVDDPVDFTPGIVKVRLPRIVSRSYMRGLKRGITTVKPFTFIFNPKTEVKKYYEPSFS